MTSITKLSNLDIIKIKKIAAYREYEKLTNNRPIGHVLTTDGDNLIFRLIYNEKTKQDLMMMFRDNFTYNSERREWIIPAKQELKNTFRSFVTKWNIFVTNDALDILKAL